MLQATQQRQNCETRREGAFGSGLYNKLKKKTTKIMKTKVTQRKDKRALKPKLSIESEFC